jgi:hypothetical protein
MSEITSPQEIYAKFLLKIFNKLRTPGNIYISCG